MKETVMYLIRHSEQIKINTKYLSSEDEQIKNENIILSIEGERKAEKLSKIEELKKLDALYSSNYVRAIATAKYIAYENNLSINIDKRLGERKLGNLATLKEIGKKSVNDYTTDQMLDENLKNKDGESNLEVRNRMIEAISEILNNNQEKKIAVISHGASIKFYLQNFCIYDEETEMLIYDGKPVCHKNIQSPGVIKIKFIGNKPVKIEEYFN